LAAVQVKLSPISLTMLSAAKIEWLYRGCLEGMGAKGACIGFSKRRAPLSGAVFN
jgi:hypothetical protein